MTTWPHAKGDRAMKLLADFVVMLLVAFSAATAADQAPTFHGIKLGVSLRSQFQECPWHPPKEGDIPKFIAPHLDDKGKIIPCFHDFSLFGPSSHPKVTGLVRLFEHFTFLKDLQDNVQQLDPKLPGAPTVFMRLLVPASASLRDGTVEEVTLEYLPLEIDRVRDDLIKKFGASHPPEKKLDPKMFEESTGAKLISAEYWETGWGKLSLLATDKSVYVSATTSKLTRFEQESKKDEF
jgi:hypothetical protein